MNENAQLKVSLQKNEGEFILDDALCNGSKGFVHCAGELETVKKISQRQSFQLDKLQSE